MNSKLKLTKSYSLSYLSLIVVLAFISSCKSKSEQKVYYESNAFVDSLHTLLTENKGLFYYKDPGSAQSITYPIFEKVHILDGLIKFFDPSTFPCSFNNKLIAKIKNLKANDKGKKGFIPNYIKNQLPNRIDTVMYFEALGSRLVYNMFNYKEPSSNKPEAAFAVNSNSFKNFNIIDNLETDDQSFNHFIYTLDCSGYFSLVVSASGGIGKNEMSVETKAGFEADRSIILLMGYVYLPLFASFEGIDKYSTKDSLTIAARINNLEAILNEINSLPNTTEIYLDRNYQIVITSNTGNSKFNGSFQLKGSAGVNLPIAQIAGKTNNGIDLTRKFQYGNYDTYILNKNIASRQLRVTKQNIIDKIHILKIEIKAFSNKSKK